MQKRKKVAIVEPKSFTPRRVIINGNAFQVNDLNMLKNVRSTVQLKEEQLNEQKKEESKFQLQLRSNKKNPYNCDDKNLNLIKKLGNMPKPEPKRGNPNLSHIGLDKSKRMIKTAQQEQNSFEHVQEKINSKPKGILVKTANVRKTKSDDIHNNHDVEDNDKNINTEQEEINQDGIISKQFQVSRAQWYLLNLKCSGNGLLKIFDNNKLQLLPMIRLPCVYFLYKSGEYRIYFKTGIGSSSVNIYVLGLDFESVGIKAITQDVVPRFIDVWKFRRAFDLELLNYYISNLKLSCTDKFLDRFKSDYELFKNPNYFDNFMKGLKVESVKKDAGKKINTENIKVLYLVYSSVEYEQYGYTIRTHNLLKNTNEKGIDVIGVTRYGYPFDREAGYADETGLKKEIEIDGVKYLKLLNDNDNYNNNNIIEYLKKYIVAVIKLANELGVNVIHATTNYWNGIAALYASKYLGLKSIYEIRGFWDEAISSYKSESKDSDMVKMMANMEIKIFNEIDKIITINTPLRDRVLTYDIDSDKVEVLFNAVDTKIFKPLPIETNDALRLKHGLVGECVIGYIGTISHFEGLEYTLECLKKLKGVKFVLIGDGLYKSEIMGFVDKFGVSNNFVYLNKIDNKETIKYYNMFDIVAYPRKDCALCRSTSSYKVFEAMAMCKPVIVSELDAWKEILIDGETGLYCKPDDVDDLFKKLKLLISDSELRNKLGKNARQWVIENREWSSIGAQLRNIYFDLINTK